MSVFSRLGLACGAHKHLFFIPQILAYDLLEKARKSFTKFTHLFEQVDFPELIEASYSSISGRIWPFSSSKFYRLLP
jgi:hypothetical protein